MKTLAQKSRILALEAIHFTDTGLGSMFVRDAAREVLTSTEDASADVSDLEAQTLRDLKAALARGERIQAIKALRNLLGVGLREAKFAVEALQGVRFVREPEAPAPLPNLSAIREANEPKRFLPDPDDYCGDRTCPACNPVERLRATERSVDED